MGRILAFHLASSDDDTDEGTGTLAVGQDLAFIGIHLDREGLSAALDAGALTDAELIACPQAWERYPSPSPRWEPAEDLPEPPY